MRSTILGDCLSNLLTFLGHEVHRINHVGDWGTQFGMLIHYLKTYPPIESTTSSLHPQQHHNDKTSLKEKDICYKIAALGMNDLMTYYKSAKQCFDEDKNGFKEAARQEVVALQTAAATTLNIYKRNYDNINNINTSTSDNIITHDEHINLRLWRLICDKSRKEYEDIYQRLNIQGLTEKGESFYNSLLPMILTQLQQQGFVTESNGAQCIFLDGYKASDGSAFPLV